MRAALFLLFASGCVPGDIAEGLKLLGFTLAILMGVSWATR